MRRLYFETSAINWILKDSAGPELLELLTSAKAAGALDAFATHNVTLEINRTREDSRRVALLEKLSQVVPVRQLSHTLIAGIYRAGTARIMTTRATTLRSALLAAGFKGWDTAQLLDATLEGCEAIVTYDLQDMAREVRKDAIKRLTGLDVLTPSRSCPTFAACGPSPSLVLPHRVSNGGHALL